MRLSPEFDSCCAELRATAEHDDERRRGFGCHGGRRRQRQPLDGGDVKFDLSRTSPPTRNSRPTRAGRPGCSSPCGARFQMGQMLEIGSHCRHSRGPRAKLQHRPPPSGANLGCPVGTISFVSETRKPHWRATAAARPSAQRPRPDAAAACVGTNSVGAGGSGKRQATRSCIWVEGRGKRLQRRIVEPIHQAGWTGPRSPILVIWARSVLPTGVIKTGSSTLGMPITLNN